MPKRRILIFILLVLIVIIGTACNQSLKEKEDLVWKDYANDYYGLQYPAQWQKKEVATKVGFTHPDNNLVGVDVSHHKLYSKQRFTDFFYANLKNIKKSESLTLESYNEKVVSGHPAYELNMLENHKDKKLKSTILFIYNKGLGTIVEYSSNKEEHKQHLPLAMKIVSSLDYLDFSFESKEVLTAEEALKDANYLWDKLEEIHPNLYFKKSQSKVEKDFAEIEKKIKAKEEWSEKDLYKLLNPFVTSFKDAHTNLSISYQFKNSVTNNADVWPLLLTNHNDQLFVQADLGNDSIPKGSQITAINGDKTAEIIAEIEQNISYERKSFANSILEKRFYLYMWLRYGNQFTIEYKDNAGELKEKKLSGITWSQYQTKRRQIKQNENYYFNLSYPQDNVALLTINTFMITDSWFKSFVDQSFSEIKEKEIDNVIIDLRYNLGGKFKLARYLYDQIAVQPYNSYKKSLTKYSNYALVYKYGYNVSYIDYALQDLEVEPATRLKEKEIDLDKLEENKNRHQGNIYVLTSSQTMSCGTNFATMVKDFERGRIIGEETGGLASFYANSIPVILPNSYLKLRVSNTKFTRPAGYDNGRGVKPDLNVEVNSKEEIKGIDQVLKETFKLIERE